MINFIYRSGQLLGFGMEIAVDVLFGVRRNRKGASLKRAFPDKDQNPQLFFWYVPSMNVIQFFPSWDMSILKRYAPVSRRSKIARL
jgi:hypothetical protein